MEYEAIRVHDDDHVRLITLDRPARRNAMSWRMLAELADAMAAADEDDDVRVVVLTNAPPVVAAINGHAIGVGLTYPLQCDVRFVAADAVAMTRFTHFMS